MKALKIMQTIENYCYPYFNKSEMDLDSLRINAVYFHRIIRGGTMKLPADKVMELKNQDIVRQNIELLAFAEAISMGAFETERCERETKAIGKNMLQIILNELEAYLEKCGGKLEAGNFQQQKLGGEKYLFQSARVLEHLKFHGAETILAPKTAESVVEQFVKPIESSDRRGKIEDFYFR
jgi:hypothetical protein